MNIARIGCCGAYCATCKVGRTGQCKGCKSGYADGSRDISKARCKIKVCCIDKEYSSCAECSEYDSCDIITTFYGKNGYKYKKYREAIDYIRSNGYKKFIKIADNWKMQYGKYRNGGR
ncbi:MAG: DUF3795 domain-containing protein [Elusimicrobia bacterium]|nr:DUF3795 domain-containing protein [Elusimicrobiota bacterium]